MQNAIRALVVFGIVLLPLFLLSPNAQALSLTEKTNLQVAMQRHVDRLTIDGVYLHLNDNSGEVQKLNPVTAHPMIIQMGPHYVLCFDFRDAAGTELPVDFYMARKGNSFEVFHTAVNNRGLLKGLMKAGKASRAE